MNQTRRRHEDRDCRSQGIGRAAKREVFVVRCDTMDRLDVAVEGVVGHFVVDEEQCQNATHQPERQADDIDHGVDFMLSQMPQRRL